MIAISEKQVILNEPKTYRIKIYNNEKKKEKIEKSGRGNTYRIE